MAAWERIDAFLTAARVRIGPPTIGQTIGGTHLQGSEHYVGRARDYGAAASDCPAVVAACLPYATGPGAVLDELFYSPLNVFMERGAPFAPLRSLYDAHLDHVHVGIVGDVPIIAGAVDAHSFDRGGGGGDFPAATPAGAGVPAFLAGLTSRSTLVRVVEVAAGAGALLAAGLILSRDLR